MNKSFIKNITTKGVKPGMTAHEEKGVIITNYILLLASGVAFLRIFLFLYTSDFYHSAISAISTVLFLFAYYMNTKQYYDFAKYFLMVAGTAAPLIKELMSGGTGNQHFLTIASFGVVFLLFSLKDKVKLIIALMLPTSSIIITTFFPNIISEPIILSAETMKMEKFFGVMSASIIIVFVIWYFVKQSANSELKLISSNDLLQKFNNEISEQKALIEEQHKALTASIQYAKDIQSVILPSKLELSNLFPDNMIFYRPKDVVSGDFYWFAETKDWRFIAVVDCTGHGVPGAFMSMIGNDLLSQIVILQGITKPSAILKLLHEGVRTTLKQDVDDSRQMDGMEVCLLAFDKNQSLLVFAGAKRPLWIVQVKNGEKKFRELKGDKYSIGGRQKEDERVFTDYVTEFKDQTLTLYLTTDGFADQMNVRGKKYGSKRFKELLYTIADKPLREQYNLLNSELAAHQGDKHQIDDITIIGVRI